MTQHFQHTPGIPNGLQDPARTTLLDMNMVPQCDEKVSDQDRSAPQQGRYLGNRIVAACIHSVNVPSQELLQAALVQMKGLYHTA